MAKKYPLIKFKKLSIWDNLESIIKLSNFLPEPIRKQDIMQYLMDRRYWIRTANDRMNGDIAFAIWHELRPGVVEYWLAATHPEHSRRRLGEKLLRTAIEISKQEGYFKFELTTFNKCHAMINLCRKMGLTEKKREKLKNPYGENHYSVVFECNLMRYQAPEAKGHLRRVDAKGEEDIVYHNFLTKNVIEEGDMLVPANAGSFISLNGYNSCSVGSLRSYLRE